MTREPLFTIASATAIAAATLGALVAFGVPLTDDQQKAVLALVAVLAPLLVAVIARPTVTPTPTSEVVAQQTTDGQVVAGQASWVEDGRTVTVEPTQLG